MMKLNVDHSLYKYPRRIVYQVCHRANIYWQTECFKCTIRTAAYCVARGLCYLTRRAIIVYRYRCITTRHVRSQEPLTWYSACARLSNGSRVLCTVQYIVVCLRCKIRHFYLLGRHSIYLASHRTLTRFVPSSKTGLF